MTRAIVLTHGGVGSDPDLKDGCELAARVGLKLMMEGAGALEAVVAAACALEDDGRFNAGSGSSLRLDGKTIEMDAAVMDSSGRLGAVAAIEGVKNPILVAREVIDTPHVLLCGQGAREFARKRGFKEFSWVSPRAKARYEEIKVAISRGDLPGWKDFDLKGNWNFQVQYSEVFPSDTIGAVAIDPKGNLAVANSTGGASPMLKGRVGDSCLIGCGFYAGPSGAVATTGIGEEIIKRTLAKLVYDRIAGGMPVPEACQDLLTIFPKDIPIGIIAISSRYEYGVAANREMAWAVLEG
jgi:L-asparaginase/beta-aspartyl-peptidase (threonine type)